MASRFVYAFKSGVVLCHCIWASEEIWEAHDGLVGWLAEDGAGGKTENTRARQFNHSSSIRSHTSSWLWPTHLSKTKQPQRKQTTSWLSSRRRWHNPELSIFEQVHIVTAIPPETPLLYPPQRVNAMNRNPIKKYKKNPCTSAGSIPSMIRWEETSCAPDHCAVS
jgi:hypothetical protein